MASKKQKKLVDYQQKDFKNDYRLDCLLSLIPKSEGKILDIGSGNGKIAINLSKQAQIVYATDRSDILLKQLNKKARGILNFKIKKIDAQDFNLEEKNFDLITACDIAEHLKNDLSFLKSCYNHLNENGRLFISAPVGKFLYGIKDKAYGHYRRYTKVELIEKLEQSGFLVLHCQYWNFIGILPYFISEKFFKRELVGPVRHQRGNFFYRALNRFLYFWLLLESKISFLPSGLSLIVLVKKNSQD